MDKGLNRTDFIAAGRKKLQQFQRKKDKRNGRHGKSLAKSVDSPQARQIDTAGIDVKSSSVDQSVSEMDSQGEMGLSPKFSSSHAAEGSAINVTTIDPSEAEIITSKELPLEKSFFAIGTEPADSSSGAIEITSLPIPIILDGENNHKYVGPMALENSSRCLDLSDTRGGFHSRVVDQEAQEAGCSDAGEVNHYVGGCLENEGRFDESEIANCPVVVADISDGSYGPVLETTSELESIHINDNTYALPYDPLVFDYNKVNGLDATICEPAGVQGCSMSHENDEMVMVGMEGVLIDRRDKLYSPGKYSATEKNNPIISESRISSPCSQCIQSAATFRDLFEKAKERLYIINIAKDFVDLQFSQQCVQQIELDCQNHDMFEEISGLRTSIKDFQNENKMLSEELRHCKCEVVFVRDESDSFREEVASLTSELNAIFARNNELQIDLDNSQRESISLSLELAKCRDMVSDLLVQNEMLKGDLSGLMCEVERVDNEKVNLAMENEKMLLEISESKRLMNVSELKNSDLDDKMISLLEEKSRLEEGRENFLRKEEKMVAELAHWRDLVSSLRIENSNLTDRLQERENFAEASEFTISENEALLLELIVQNEALFMWHVESMSSERKNLRSENSIDQTYEQQTVSTCGQETNIEELNVKKIQLSQNHAVEGDDDCFSAVLQGRVQEAEKIIQQLYASAEQMYSHSASLRKSSGVVASVGVSKLIQAFESKSNLLDGNDSDKDAFPSDYFLSLKRLIGALEAIIIALTLDIANAGKIFASERGSLRFSNTAMKELSSQLEMLEEHSDIVEMWSIEIEVLHEVLKQKLENVELENAELEVEYEYIERENSKLKVVNSDLSRKVINGQLKLNELLTKFLEVKKSSEVVSCTLFHQLESSQDELIGSVAALDHKFDDFVAQITEKFDKLNAFVGVTSRTDVSDVCYCVEASVGAAIDLIESLHEKFESTSINLEVFRHALMEMDKNCYQLRERSTLSINMLYKIHEALWKLVDNFNICKEENEYMVSKARVDPLDFNNYAVLLKYLVYAMECKNELESINSKLILDMSSKMEEIEELKCRFVDPNFVHSLIEDVELSSKLEEGGVTLSSLQNFIRFLVCKYKDAKEQIVSLKEETAIMVDKNEQDTCLWYMQLDNIILVLKESWNQAEMDFDYIHTEIHKKESELDQSEQRVSSLREKLSLAVAKGKGLIIQRDNLKKSLAETTFKLERCSEELNDKNIELSEVEVKIKAYAEAGERAEALESELSYIRNSAAALRESFLHKDSLLQRIEEILEDLKLPEEFHSKDTIEKVDWLARSIADTPFPADSCTDTTYVLRDPCQEDVQCDSNPVEDFERKFDELQSQFYGLAEHNEMLEQSLMERNNLVLRWENAINRINFPSSVQSFEPEDKIDWLGGAYFESHNLVNELEQSVCTLEKHNASLSAEVDKSEERISHLRSAFDGVSTEKDDIYRKLADLENENTELQKNVWESFHERKLSEERIQNMEERIRRLQELVGSALQSSHMDEVFNDGDGVSFLEELLGELIQKYTNSSFEKPVVEDDVRIVEQRIASDLAALMLEVIFRDMLDAAKGDLVHANEQKEKYVVKHDMLVHEVDILSKKQEEMLRFLSTEEQKTASLREKLNVAVRKGKLLVQQRDGLKEAIEVLNTELNQLKAENGHQKNSISEYKEKNGTMDSEILLLSSRLADSERLLAEKEEALDKMVSVLYAVDANNTVKVVDPIEKLKNFLEVFNGLRESLASAEHESRKSRRAAELLLAELNEVQERNDGLQEELEKSVSEISTLSQGRDMAEAAKLDALSHVEELYMLDAEKMKRLNSALFATKLRMDVVKKQFYDINGVFTDVSSRDVELLKNLQTAIKSYSEDIATDSCQLHLSFQPAEIFCRDLECKNVAVMESSEILRQGQFGDTDIFALLENQVADLESISASIRDNLHRHAISLNEEASKLAALMFLVKKTLNSQKEEIDQRNREINRLESVEKEKEVELASLHRSTTIIFQACLNSIQEMENSKAHLFSNGFISNKGVNLDLPNIVDGEYSLAGQNFFYAEHDVSVVTNKLLSCVKDFASMQIELVGQSQKELKLTIASLQKELQEKDAQRERTCSDLVRQIKKAEADAEVSESNYQSAKAKVQDLEERLKELGTSCNSLEKQVKELQDGEAKLAGLEERARSLVDTLGSKEHEIEDLMEALNEDGLQIGELRNKIQDLNSVLQKKDIDLEKAEASHAKAVKKLSVTITRFDELHHLSDDLLSEIEKLQLQLRERDNEISFLRQEVTRCTNEVLDAPAVYNKKYEDEIRGMLTSFNEMISRVHVNDTHKDQQVDEYRYMVGKQIEFMVSELESLRAAAQTNDALLQAERMRVEDLQHRVGCLEPSLEQPQMNILNGVDSHMQPTTATASEIPNVEPMRVMEEWSKPSASVLPQVRSLRKGNNDHVSIAVAMDPSTDATLADEDDDKVHGFKSLTTSRFVPRFMRPLSDLIDGLWVSCDRALMRQPAFRLGIILYWSFLHTLLATHMV